jgi:hypothetical protein
MKAAVVVATLTLVVVFILCDFMSEPLPPWLNINPMDYLKAAEAGTQAGLERSRIALSAQQDFQQNQLAQSAQQGQMQQRQAADALRRDQLGLTLQNTQTRQQQQAAAIALKMAQMQQAGLMGQAKLGQGQEKIDQSGQTAAAKLAAVSGHYANEAAHWGNQDKSATDRNQILALAQAWKQQQSEKENKWSDTDSKDAKSLDQQILGYFRAYSSATPANQKVLQDKISDLMGQRKAISSKYQTAASTLTAGTGTNPPAPAPAPTQPASPAAAALTRTQSNLPTPTNAPPSQTGKPIPTPADIDYLRANPKAAAKFDARFGAGLSAQILAGQSQTEEPLPHGMSEESRRVVSQ